MRYAVSGSNSAAITPATASSAQNVLGKVITSGRHFWLRGLSISPNATHGPLNIIDATTGGTATGPVVSIGLDPTVNQSIVVNFGAPGLLFKSGCVARLDASGSIGIGLLSGWGYEE